MNWTSSSFTYTTVAIYIYQFPPNIQFGGGCILQYFHVMKQLLAEHHRVVVYSPVSAQEVLEFAPELSAYVDKGMLVFFLLPSIKNQIFHNVPIAYVTPTLIGKIGRHLRQYGVQVLLCPDNAESSVLMCLAKLVGVPYTVYGIHTDIYCLKYADSWKCMFFKWIAHLNHIVCSRIADWTVSSSKLFCRQMKLRTQYIGVRMDYAWEYPIWSSAFCLGGEKDADIAEYRERLTQGSPSSPLVVYVGRWSPEKRILKLLDAIPSGWKLAIIGDGVSEEDIVHVNSLQSSDVYVRQGMLGGDELAKVYKTADFMVSASDCETLGMTVVESMACGTPVVVQAAGGFLETVQDGVDGLLVDYDYPKECQERMSEYHPNSVAYQTMCENVCLRSQKLVSTSDTRSYLERLIPQVRVEPLTWACRGLYGVGLCVLYPMYAMAVYAFT